MYIKLTLHLWSKDNLVMVGDLLDVSLNSMCKYFVENFVCVCVISSQASLIFFFLLLCLYLLLVSGY